MAHPFVSTLVFAALALLAAAAGSCQADLPAGSVPVISADALSPRVGGLERTSASAEMVPIAGQPFTRALRVTIKAASTETNATQLCIPNVVAVSRGDAMLASFWIRGASTDGNRPAQMEFLFERSTDPWTKSTSLTATAPRKPGAWARAFAPFTCAQDYAPGAAMVSLRFAFGPQTIEVGGLTVVSYGKTRTTEELVAIAADAVPLGRVAVVVKPAETKQTMLGLGGNFCQPRYGRTEAMDGVGAYSLANLKVAHARVGIPLNWWTPTKGEYRDDAQAHAAFLLLQDLHKRGIPLVGSVWEGPEWMLGGRREQMGRVLPPERYGDCIEAIAQFLVTARDMYGVTVDYFSFNEPDYGVNFKFTPATMAAFIRRAGPRFAALGLKTRFIVADTANGAAFPDYARPLLDDAQLKPYLGPLGFHCWDALSAQEAVYRQIGELGRQYGKDVWCLEAGHDAALWEQPNPWESWENALRTATAYERTIRLTRASVMDYWTYQDNYPIASRDGGKPFPIFHVIKQMQDVFASGSRVVGTSAGNEALRALATVGPGTSRAAVLLVNPIGKGAATLSGLPAGAPARIIVSDARSQARASTATVDRSGTLSVTIPARSVVTVICEKGR